MGFIDNIVMALENIRANKMRSLLTMLGIIIGIAAVIAIQTVGDSMTGSISDEFASFGATNITVDLSEKSTDTGDDWASGGGGGGGGMFGADVRMFRDSTPRASDLITDDMLAQYKAAFPDKIKYITTSSEGGQATITCQYDSSTTVTTSVYGVNVDYLDANKVEMLYGRPLTEDDMTTERHVAVVADQFVTDALNTTPVNAVGKSFKLNMNNHVVTLFIAGVYRYDESSNYNYWGGSDEIVTNMYVPITLVQTINGANKGYRSITVTATTDTDTNDFLTTTGDYFASFYTRNDSWTVQASSMQQYLESMTSTLSTVSLAISAIAAIALLVGGIGVMNIMTVSVTERTREIGTRKALGAPGGAIRAQFIIEAAVVCLIGGMIGTGLGIALGMGISKAMGYAATPSLVTILIAVGFSVGIGVFFGYYPANKAAKMDPIEALRYE